MRGAPQRIEPEQKRLQQFYLRVLLGVGIMWGLVPLIMVPFVARGSSDTALDVGAAISNGLTILPACVLALWHRRPACVWLSANAGLILAAVVLSSAASRAYRFSDIIALSVPLLLAGLLDMSELLGWPGAICTTAA